MSDTPTPNPATDPTPPADRAAFWRRAVADHAASGLSVRGHCRRRGLREKRFFTWRRSPGLGPVGRPVGRAAAAPGFVPVRVVPDTTADVTRPGGVAVRVPVHADPAAVARRVAALAGGGRRSPRARPAGCGCASPRWTPGRATTGWPG